MRSIANTIICVVVSCIRIYFVKKIGIDEDVQNGLRKGSQSATIIYSLAAQNFFFIKQKAAAFDEDVRKLTRR